MKTHHLSKITTALLCSGLCHFALASDATQAIGIPSVSASHAPTSNLGAHLGLAADPESDATTLPPQPTGNQDYHVRPTKLDRKFGQPYTVDSIPHAITDTQKINCNEHYYVSNIQYKYKQYSNANPIKLSINGSSGKVNGTIARGQIPAYRLYVSSYTCTPESTWRINDQDEYVTQGDHGPYPQTVTTPHTK